MKRLFVFTLLCALLAACQRADALPNQDAEEVEKQKLHQAEEMATIIDWVDFIQFEGKHYVSAESAIISEKSGIGEKAGEVSFKVADNIDDPYYKIQNGDAAFWEKGTSLFKVKELPDFLAVADDSKVNGYRLYLAEQPEEEFPHHFKDVNLDSVNLIEIYTAQNKPELRNRLGEEELERFKELLLQAYEPSPEGRNAGQYDPEIYQMILYTDEPFAHAFYVYNEGGQWLWHPWDEQFLPLEIEPFMEPAT